MWELPRATRINESADAHQARGPIRMPGVPRQPARSGRYGCSENGSRCRSACIPRSAVSAISELHHLPPEDPWKPRGPESAAVRLSLMLVLLFPLAAHTPAARAPEATTASAAYLFSVSVGRSDRR